jgi:DNA polymerase elongation subunit (family B)
MEFRILDCRTFHEQDSPDDDEDGMECCNDRFMIQLYGIDEARNTYSVTISEFKPSFYVKIPESFHATKRRDFVQFIKEKLGKFYEDSLVQTGLVERAKLYGFDARAQHRFMFFKFNNMAAFHRAKNLWFREVATAKDSKFSKKAGVKWALNPSGLKFRNDYLQLYEANIAPLLRFFHIREISPTGWVRVNTFQNVRSKTTSCAFELHCTAADIVPLPKDSIVPLKICSFDIEASSSHGDFPLAVKDYKKLAQNILDVVDSRTKVDIITVYECLQSAFGFASMFGIDLVYPKEPLDSCALDDLIQEWSESSLPEYVDEAALRDVHAGDDESAKGDDNEEENENENENDNENGKEKGPATFDQVALPKGKTIMDLVLDKSFDKQIKVAALTQSLGNFFPALEGDRVTYIGSTFVKYGTSKPYLNHCINIGPTDPLDNVTMVHCTTEQEVLLAWTALIQEEDPDIIMGYNIFGFDEHFMFQRALETDCVEAFLKLGRNHKNLAGKKNDAGRWQLEEKALVVASGEYNMRFFDLEGRIHFDPYVMFRKDYNLDSYKLDSVAATFIRDKVTEIQCIDSQPVNTTKVFSSNLKGLEKGNYVVFEEFTHSSTYLFNGRKYQVTEVAVDHFVVQNRLIYTKKASAVLSWCLAKDDVDHHDIFRMAQGDLTEKATIAAYCVQDCNLVHHLVQKVDMITSCMEMANVCCVPFDYIVFRGQGAKLTSLIAKKCKENGILMPVLPSSEFDSGFEGALVLKPICGIYNEDPVGVNDFSSLYPSKMISENLSSDSLVWSEETDLEGNIIIPRNPSQSKYDNLPGYTYVDLSYDTFREVRKTPKGKLEKIKKGTVVCRWAQFPDNQLGIMPAVLRELLKARKDTRKKAETEPDYFMRGVLDKRQLAFKMTANSIYGQCGAKTSTFYNKHVAACCTAGGRMQILYAKTVVEDVYKNLEYETEAVGKVTVTAENVYGDTDSVFFRFIMMKDGVKLEGKEALAATIEIAQDVGKVATQFLKPPHDWVYEKTFYPFILLGKKKYVGMLYETDTTKCKRKSMGIVLKRRDNAPIVKDIYGGVIDRFMEGKPVSIAVDFVSNELRRIMQHDYDAAIDKFVITKSLRSGYKNPKQIAHKVLADRIGQRDPGNKPRPGDRISFLYVETPKAPKGVKLLQGDKIETPEFKKANNLKLDYDHYVSNQIMKPVQQLLALALENIPNFKPKHFIRKLEEAKKDKKFADPVKYEEKTERLRLQEVKELVFDPFLAK